MHSSAMNQANSKEGLQVEGGTLQDRLQLLEEQKKKDAEKLVAYKQDDNHVSDDLIRERLQWMDNVNVNEQQTPEKAAIVVEGEGGTLQDRLRLLEEQKKKDAKKLVAYKKDDTHVSDDLIRERLQWMDKVNVDKQQTPEKAAIVVEGGGLKDRLKLLEETRQKEAARLTAYKHAGHTSDALIRERMKWMEDASKQSTLQKEAIIIEGGGVKDRLKLLELQRQQEALRLAPKSSGLETISDDLIRERLRWMDEQKEMAAAAAGNSKAAIIVQGGNLQERLRLLEEQRRRQAEKGSSNTTDLSHVSDDLIRERLQWMEQQQQMLEAGGEGKESIVIEGGNLAERKQLLDEQRRREAERLAVRRLVEVSSDAVQDRMQWLQQKGQPESNEKAPQHEIMSSDLIAERMAWLKENAEKAAQLPEKERIEMTNNLVKQRKEWIDENIRKAKELPPKERIEVTQGLISERIGWLHEQMNKTNSMSQNERTQMTSDLITERIAYLEAQIQAHADAEAKANLEMQINFLEEQQQVAGQMTDDEANVLANVLITEKMQDLEQQKEFIAEISEDQQIEVTQALLEDRQAWLEGDPDHYARRREEQKRAQEEAEARALEEQATAARIREEVVHSISFWNQQRESAAQMSAPERAQITAFLIAEHVVSLELQLEDASIDTEAKESVEQQIAFLNDQMENIDDIDHIMMIDVLVEEKVKLLEKMLE